MTLQPNIRNFVIMAKLPFVAEITNVIMAKSPFVAEITKEKYE